MNDTKQRNSAWFVLMLGDPLYGGGRVILWAKNEFPALIMPFLKNVRLDLFRV